MGAGTSLHVPVTHAAIMQIALGFGQSASVVQIIPPDDELELLTLPPNPPAPMPPAPLLLVTFAPPNPLLLMLLDAVVSPPAVVPVDSIWLLHVTMGIHSSTIDHPDTWLFRMRP